MEQLRYDSSQAESLAAFRSIRTAKHILALLIVLCILMQMMGFVLVRFTDVVGPLSAAATVAEKTTSKPIAAVAAVEEQTTWESILNWVLPGTRRVALVACLLMAVAALFATQLSLVERAGGVGGFVSAFFWSILLLAMLIPWRPILDSSVFCGSMFTLNTVQAATSRIKSLSATALDQTAYYLRYIIYPLLTLLVWLVVQVKFARGYMRLRPTQVADSDMS